jgi:5'-methylthioadenosine phosphorylase
MLKEKADELDVEFHEKGTCVVIEGPRFSTKAESNLFRSWNADIINMTLVPEVVLAREAEICYVNIAMVTDYDCWKEDNVVSHAAVLATMKKNLEKVKKLLMAVIPEIEDTHVCSCNTALAGSEM